MTILLPNRVGWRREMLVRSRKILNLSYIPLSRTKAKILSQFFWRICYEQALSVSCYRVVMVMVVGGGAAGVGKVSNLVLSCSHISCYFSSLWVWLFTGLSMYSFAILLWLVVEGGVRLVKGGGGRGVVVKKLHSYFPEKINSYLILS